MYLKEIPFCSQIPPALLIWDRKSDSSIKNVTYLHRWSSLADSVFAAAASIIIVTKYGKQETTLIK